jgi:hypothetical protein
MSPVRLGLIAAVAAAFEAGSLPAQEHDSTAAVRSTVTGTVVRLDTMRMDHGGRAHEHGAAAQHHQREHAMMTRDGGGLALAVLSGTDTISVHLGPLSYLKQANPDGFAVGDRITVDGIPMTDSDHPHWMAYGVTKGDLAVKLRDDHGKPVWMEGMPATGTHRMMRPMPGDTARHHPPN